MAGPPEVTELHHQVCGVVAVGVAGEQEVLGLEEEELRARATQDTHLVGTPSPHNHCW